MKKKLTLLAFALTIALSFGSSGLPKKATAAPSPSPAPKSAISGTTVVGGSLENLNQTQMDQFDPIKISGGGGAVGDGKSVGKVVSVFLKFAYALATIILTIMLIWGGLEIMTAGTTGKAASAENGKKRAIAAVIGFLIVFGSFLIMQVVMALLGIKIPGLTP